MKYASDWSALGSPFAGSHETERGYTGHEHLDTVGLIHMNGRVQDPILGRFISADPFVQAPFNTQSHNRYSYVWNNPGSLIDPSGFQTEDARRLINAINDGTLDCSRFDCGQFRQFLIDWCNSDATCEDYDQMVVTGSRSGNDSYVPMFGIRRPIFDDGWVGFGGGSLLDLSDQWVPTLDEIHPAILQSPIVQDRLSSEERAELNVQLGALGLGTELNRTFTRSQERMAEAFIARNEDILRRSILRARERAAIGQGIRAARGLRSRASQLDSVLNAASGFFNVVDMTSAIADARAGRAGWSKPIATALVIGAGYAAGASAAPYVAAGLLLGEITGVTDRASHRIDRLVSD